jgi:hypothetical protein
MMRNLKALGTAIVAVLALSAFVASAAQAAEAHFTSETGTTTIKGTSETEVSHQIFTTTAGKVECSGHFTNRETVPTTDTKLTMNAEYKECTPFFGATPKVEMKSCHFTFKAGTYGPTAGTSVGTADIVCSNAAEPITITVPGCTVTVKGQTGLSKVHYQTNTNAATGKTDVTVKPEVSNIAYAHNGFLCGTGSGTTGTYTGPVTVQGFNSKGAATNISITST